MTNEKLLFKKKGYKSGTIRNYGKYGDYEKQANGSWKRLKKGYPTFRRTLKFSQIKKFLLEKGYGEAYIERHSSPQLRKLMKSVGWTRQFNKWVKEREVKNGKN